MKTAVQIFYTLSALAGLTGGFLGVEAYVSAESAPQQAAGAAIGCLIAIAPYVFARSVEGILRPDDTGARP